MNDLQTTEAMPLQTQNASNGYMAIIEKLAENPTAESVSVLERLMAVQERWEAKEAEKAFNEAMARIAEKLSHIRICKTKSVGYDIDKNNKALGQKEAFKYIPLDEVDKVIRPILVEENMSVAWTTEERTTGGGGAVVTARISHKGGHFREAAIPLTLDTSGGKSNIQAMGSTISYGRRYTLCMLLNIVTLDDDDGMGGCIDEAQAAHIKQKLKETEADVVGFLKYMKVADVESIPFKDYRKATTVIDDTYERKLKKQASK